MSNALAVYERMNELTTAATALHASGFFSDVRTQAQAMVKVLAGAEIGLPPFASMSGIHIVQGKPVLGANLIATLVKNDPRYNYRVKRADNEACVLEWYEGGKLAGESAFTMAEAQAAGLTGKDNWRKYPSDMLFARALTRGARRYAPGIFGGAPIYTPDELGVETDEEGHIIEGQIVTVEATPAPAQQSQARPQPPAQPARAQQPATNGNGGNGQPDPGPLADDELTISEAKPGDFVNLAASLLDTDAMTIKQRMAAGNLPFPRNGSAAVAAYRALKAGMGKADATLFDVSTVDVDSAALASAKGELN